MVFMIYLVVVLFSMMAFLIWTLSADKPYLLIPVVLIMSFLLFTYHNNYDFKEQAFTKGFRYVVIKKNHKNDEKNAKYTLLDLNNNWLKEVKSVVIDKASAFNYGDTIVFKCKKIIKNTKKGK